MVENASSRKYISVDGYNVVTYTYGSVITQYFYCGGPGLPCDYLRDPHIYLADKGYKVVAFDQLGCGRSDRPKDPSLWNISRYVEEVEIVRKGLNLEKVHLRSLQGWLAKYRIIQKMFALLLHVVISHFNRPGSETAAMMLHHEAEKSYDHPEYQVKTITILNYRHVCRLKQWPKSLFFC